MTLKIKKIVKLTSLKLSVGVNVMTCCIFGIYIYIFLFEVKHFWHIENVY